VRLSSDTSRCFSLLIDSGLVGSTDFTRGTSLEGIPREQEKLKGHLPRVIYHPVYSYTKIRTQRRGLGGLRFGGCGFSAKVYGPGLSSVSRRCVAWFLAERLVVWGRVWGLRMKLVGPRAYALGLKAERRLLFISGFSGQDFQSRVQGSGFRIQGSGFRV